MAKDNHDSESDDYGAPCHRRSTKRASSKKHSGTDHLTNRVGLLDPPRDRAYHKGMSSATSSSSVGRRSNTLVKEFALETPLSPISNRFGSKKSRHHMDQSLANKVLDDSETSRRYLLSHAPSPYRDSNWRTHRSSELAARVNHTSSRRNPVHSEVRVNSHYLDETDIVSSDSLSPDDGTDNLPLRGGSSASQRLSTCKSVILRSSGTRRSLVRSDHLRVNRSHRRNSPSFESLSNSLKHLDDPDSGSSSPVNVHPRGLSRHRQTTSSSSSPPRPFLRAGVAAIRHRSREDGKGSTSRVVFPSQRCARSQATDPYASAANSFVDRDFLNTSGSKHTAIGDHTTLTGSKQSPGRNTRVNSGDESGASRLAKFCQLADSADESHDTLTKLEQERAKLLRELSLLNNEVVVGTKPKLAVFPNRKRDADDAFATNVQTSKLRRTESSKGDSESTSEELQPLSSSDGGLASRILDQYVHAPPSALVTPVSDVAAGNSLKPKVPAVRVGHRDTSESTELASLTGAERTSPFSESGRCDIAEVHAATHDQTDSLKPSNSLSTTDGFSQSLVTSSPRLIMPPKPTSPLTCLSPPGSPLAIDKMPLLNFDSEKTRAMVPWTLELPQPPDMKPISVSCNASSYSRPDLSILPVPSRTEATKTVSMEPVINDSERDASVCSLDERIRLLDAQLMKSGKVRPAVDYSKFRIRRKAEPNLATSDRPTTSSSSSGYGNSTPSSHNTAVPEVTGSPAGFAAYSDRGHFYDGSIPALPGMCTGVNSVSPLDNLQTSPLIRPADTSEFVKSMLSSKPSPSVPVVDQPSGPTLDSSTCLRTAHNRYAAVTISNPSPLKSVTDAIGSASVASTSPCLANRHFNASSACQYLPPSGAIGHNLPVGTQPVGVATRLPLISQVVEGSSHAVDTEIAPPLKSILKNDLTSPGCPAIGLEAANKSIPTELRPSVYLNIPDVKEARDERSTGLSLTKTAVHQTNSIKSEVPNSTSSPRFSHCESQKLVLSAKTKTASTSKQATSTAPPRSSKTDVVRPTLDDSIFRTSFTKTERKKEKLKRARQADATAKVIPKPGNSGTRNQPQISNGSPRVVATHTENMQPSFAEGKNSRQERTLFIEKRVGRVQSNHHKAAKVLGDKPVPAKRVPNANVSVKSASVHTKKSGIEQRGRPTDSDGSDWERGSCSLEKAGSVVFGEAETGYESMYDKIKRRASKGTGKLMDPLSNRNSNQSGGRVVTKSNKKRDSSRNSVSVLESVNDSDTDECLSDTSFSEVKPKPARVHRRQVGSTNLKTADHLQKKTPTCQKKGQKKRVDDNLENPLSNSNRGGKPQSRGTLNLQDSVGRRGSGRGRVKRVAKPTHHNSPSPDFPSSSSLPPKRRRCIVENQSGCNSSLFKSADSQPTKHKTKPELSSVSERQPRSLVRRVFASSDSDSSFSSSNSESEGRSKSKTVLKSVVPPLTPSPASRSSDSPPISGSCSPDDLGADAAVRHTFSAFLSPASHNSEEKKVEVSSRSVENVNRSTVTRVSDVTNPTSSTLPLTDTGSSADQTGSLNSKRDPSEWNIFTSLTNHSTPKRELPSGITTSMAVSVGSIDDSSHKQTLESDDELPSLEKHDEDDSARLCSDSIELNDNDSLLGHANGRSTDDDLPPPVVSALDDPSPPRIYSEDHQNSVQPDVIEEVIYDSMEVHVSPSEQQTSLSRPQSLEKRGSSPPLPVISTRSEPKATAIMTPLSQCDMDVVVSSTTSSSLTQPLSDSQLSASSSIASIAPLAPLSLHSSVFTPITMLTSASQPDEMPTVGQSVLVTVPRATPGVTFSSQGLTLVPTSCPAPQIATPATPRHVTLILPATSVSLNTSVLSIQNPVTTTVYTTPTLVYNTTISNSPVCVLPTPNTVASVYIKRGDQDLSTGVGTNNTSVNTKAVELTSSGSIVIPTPLEQSAYAGVSGNTMLDPSDYTSYVQRVIERVKQEKDEESMQQREKSKRSKKIPPAVISVPPTCSSSVSFHPTLTTVALTPCVAVSPITPLLPIAPMPVTSKLSSISQSSDGGGTISAARKAPDPKIIIKPDPAEVPLTSVNCEPRSANMTNEQEACVRLKMDASEQNNQDDQTSSTVDEVIDAVVSGHFDESDYLQKLAVGTLDQPLLQRHPVISSSGQLVSLSSLHAVGEQSNALVNSIDVVVSKSPLLCSDRTVKSPLANGNLMTPDVLASTTPPRVFTPMHVLTLVATGGSSINQNGSDSTAISPGLISQTSNLPGISVSSQSVNHATTQSLASAISSSSASETLAPPSSSSHRIDHLAAQFANYPLTKYFYSLLAQQQMETSPNSLSSEPTTVSQAESSVSTGALHSTLKSLTVPPSSNSNDTSEFFAAVATMAAMASPPRTGISGSSETSIVNTTRTDLPAAHSFSVHPWSSGSSETQDYPIGWRGRLSLKNEEVFVHMHYLSGNQGLLKDCMGVISEQNSSPSEQDVSTLPLLRIVQRMRLDPSQLDGVQRKLRQVNDFCMCLTLAAASPMTPESSAVGETIRMNQVLCDNFIKYMVDKCAAGIVNVCNPFTNQNLYVIHIFPPCDFARCQLEGISPALHRQLTQTATPYLLVVITTV
ncbi:SPOC domain protein, partial [Opisthorchis viverrini]